MRPSTASLWRHASFIKLWSGQTISQFGSHIGGGALRLTAIQILGATPFQLGLLTAAQLAPALLLGLLAGVWVDRLRRRPILIAADLGRGLLLLSVPLAFALGVLRVEQLYVVAGLAGALSLFFDVAYGAFLPSLIGRERLVEGNSKLSASDSIAEIAGPPAGGLLVQVLSAPLAILFDALSFLASALAIWSIRTHEPAPGAPSAAPNIRREMIEGLRAVANDALLRPLLGAAVTLSLFGNMIGALYDLYLIRDLGFSPAVIGLTIGIGGVSALFGAFLATPVVTRFGVGPTLGSVLALKIFTVSLLPLAHGPLALPMLLIGQAGDVLFAIYAIAETSVRQSLAPEHKRGRINASFTVVVTGAGLVGAQMGGLLAEWLGVRGALVIAALGISTACLWIVASPLWRVRVMPEVALGAEA
jgi:MFS family permease